MIAVLLFLCLFFHSVAVVVAHALDDDGIADYAVFNTSDLVDLDDDPSYLSFLVDIDDEG